MQDLFCSMLAWLNRSPAAHRELVDEGRNVEAQCRLTALDGALLQQGIRLHQLPVNHDAFRKDPSAILQKTPVMENVVLQDQYLSWFGISAHMSLQGRDPNSQ